MSTVKNTVISAPASMAIIVCCAIVYMAGNISATLALWPLESGTFQIWQLLSYGFLHGSFSHLFFNMFAVWMFGTQLEHLWGSERFIIFYLVCVVGAAIAQILVQQFNGGIYPTIGASGGVFGLLLAYGAMWPNNKLYLMFFPIGIKAKWFVLIYGAGELLFGITGAAPGIAHFAHLGGMVFGAGLLWKWGWRPTPVSR